MACIKEVRLDLGPELCTPAGQATYCLCGAASKRERNPSPRCVSCDVCLRPTSLLARRWPHRCVRLYSKAMHA